MKRISKSKAKTCPRSLRPKRQKRIWTSAEDLVLLGLIQRFGPARWSTIACHMQGRQGKQCRERWHNHLNPDIVKTCWLEEEEWLLFLLYKLYGSRWAVLAHMIPGRTDNTIKNHWNSIMRRKTRALEQRLQECLAAPSSSVSDVEGFLLQRIASNDLETHVTKKGRKRSYSRFFDKNPLEQFIAQRQGAAAPALAPVCEPPTSVHENTPQASRPKFLYQLHSKTPHRSAHPIFSAEQGYAPLLGTEEKLNLGMLLRCTPEKMPMQHPLDGSLAKYFRRTEEGVTTPKRAGQCAISAFDLPQLPGAEHPVGLSLAFEWD